MKLPPLPQMAALELPFAFGATYWLPVSHGRKVEVPCPVCAGNCRITVILGDGEHVSLPCDGCGIGYEGPRGYVSEYSYDPGAASITIDAVDSMRDGKWRVLTSDGNTHEFAELFATQDEALKHSGERCAASWEAVMVSHQGKRKWKTENLGYTVRYHRQQIAELKKKIAWHEEKVQAVK